VETAVRTALRGEGGGVALGVGRGRAFGWGRKGVMIMVLLLLLLLSEKEGMLIGREGELGILLRLEAVAAELLLLEELTLLEGEKILRPRHLSRLKKMARER
jgi:hypothetical protein